MFDVEIYLEGGAVIKRRFETFTVKKQAGSIHSVEWKLANDGEQMIRLNVDKVLAVLSTEVPNGGWVAEPC